MAGGKRESGRELAALIAVYGFWPGFTMTYAVYVQLLLNLERVRLQRSLDVAKGFGAIMTQDDLDRDWADAMAYDRAEVDEIEFNLHKQRAEARRRSRMQQQRGGGGFFG